LIITTNKLDLYVEGALAMRILLSWIGAQDPWIPPEGRRAGKLQRFSDVRPDGASDGPILSFLHHSQLFDVLYLLTDPAISATGAVEALLQELTKRHARMKLELRHVPIDDPRAYDQLYPHMRAICKEAADSHDPDAEFNILLTPGTPQMHAMWILLSNTSFNALLWQGSDQPGRSRSERVNIPFNIETEIIEPTRLEAMAALPDLGSTDFICRSAKMRQATETLLRATTITDLPILLLGERGTGKEVLARIAHYKSPQANRPFVALNCASLPEQLADSELFGHRRGAFTGADRDRPGLFEVAQGGTLLLDEIGELPLGTQAKLLRVMQEKRVRRLGATDEIVIDIHLLAATNRDIRTMVAEKAFRADLYDRLNGVTIQVPPLRERLEDIDPLIDHFLAIANRDAASRQQKQAQLTTTARRRLLRHSWPGNVRELDMTIKRLVALAVAGKINVTDVQRELTRASIPLSTLAHIDAELRPGRGRKEIVEDVERELYKQAAQKYGIQTRIGAALGITQQAISGWKLKLGIDD